jgi:outer membrane protein assembly factor BamB
VFVELLATTPTTAYILGAPNNTVTPVLYSLHAVHVATGRVAWSQSDGSRQITPGMRLVVAGQALICSDPLHNVTVRSAATGVVSWNVNLGKSNNGADPAPYLAASPRLGIAITARIGLTGRDLVNGTRKWLIPALAVDNAFDQPVMSPDGAICYAVVDSNPGAVLAVDARTGYKKWDTSQYFTGQNPPALAGGLLFISAQAGGQAGMYAFAAATGENLWSFQDATAAGGNEWMLAGVPSSSAIVAMHDSAVLALPAIS